MAKLTITIGSDEINYGPDFQRFAKTVNEDHKRAVALEKEAVKRRAIATAAKGELTPHNVNRGDINEVAAYLRQQFPDSMGSYDISRRSVSSIEDATEEPDIEEGECESPQPVGEEGGEWAEQESEFGSFKTRTSMREVDSGVFFKPNQSGVGGSIRLRGTKAAIEASKKPTKAPPKAPAIKKVPKPTTLKGYYPTIPRTKKGDNPSTNTLDQPLSYALPSRRMPVTTPRTVSLVRFEEVE